MQGYMAHFLVYSMAMVGFFGVCLYIYKNLCIKGLNGNSTDFLSVENGIRINARKQILVVKAGDEKFLIASDLDRTTMLAKLNTENTKKDNNEQNTITELNDINEQTDDTAVNKTEVIEKHLYSSQVLNFKPIQEEDVPPVLKRINEKMKG